MMKKICVFLILILLFTPINIHASEVGDVNIPGAMKFEDIEKEILEKNKVVEINKNILGSMEANYDLIEEIKDDIDDDEDDLEDAIDILEIQISRLEADKASLEAKIDGDQELVNHIKQNYDALIGIYEYNKASLKATRNSLRDQNTSLNDQKDDLEDAINKFKLQSEMANYQLVWTAQNLYITYTTLCNQEMDLRNKIELIEKQLEIAKVNESLGKITEIDIDSLELQISEIELALNGLQTQKDAIIGELNLMLGKSYDSFLIIDTVLKPVSVNLNDDVFVKDLETVIDKSYTITLQILECETKERILRKSDERDNLSEEASQFELENEEIKLEEAKKEVSLSFHKAYEDVISKKKSFEQEKKKLEQANTNKDFALIKHELGKISDIELKIEMSNYQLQEIEMNASEYEFIQSYLRYDWMKRGLTL